MIRSGLPVESIAVASDIFFAGSKAANLINRGASVTGLLAAAARMAADLGEKVGETIGLRVRLQSLVSARTRVEVVTEGVFARMILDDPSLEDVAAVLFDEFHERSLDADLGLAFALEDQRNIGAGAELNLVVAIEKREVEDARQVFADRGLAGPHRSDQENVVLADHRAVRRRCGLYWRSLHQTRSSRRYCQQAVVFGVEVCTPVLVS